MARRVFLGGAAATVGLLATRWLRRVGAQPSAVTDPEERKRIEAALPAKAMVAPRKPRRLLIFDLNVGYGGHRSIPTANTAFTLMGARTGAFETAVSRDPSVFKAESLRQFDAVFFNNTVGNCFEDPTLRQNLVEFVYGGGGLMGVHGTSVAFTKWPGAIEDWPEFGIMLGARGANHKTNDEHVFIKLDDPTHPVNQIFGGRDFDYRDEFFRVHEPYSRDRVRVLMSIDTAKTDMQQSPSYGKVERADNDYALAWVRHYGRGRVFYCGFAHHPSVFWDPKMLQFYLAATQFALGDLPAPTTPSAKLTPAMVAQERLGWPLGFAARPDGESTLFESIDEAAKLDLLCLGACSSRMVGSNLEKRFDDRLSSDERSRIRLKLDAVGVRLLTYRVDRAPADDAAWRGLFEFARTMGVETIIAAPSPDALDTIEKLCDEYDVHLAIDSDEGSPVPLEALRQCRKRSKRLGIHADISSWLRPGVESIDPVRTLGDRLLVLRINKPAGSANDKKVIAALSEIHRLGLRPAMFSIEAPSGAADSAASATQNIELFNRATVELAERGTP